MSTSSLTIGIVAPARAIERETAEALTRFVAEFYGRDVTLRFHPQCFLREGHFAGSDETRTLAFLEYANAADIDLIWFARGGYGSMRLYDKAFDELNEHARAKAYIGYSDMGAMLARLYRLQIGRPVHASMPSALGQAGGEQAIRWVLDSVTGRNKDGLETSMKTPHPRIAINLTVLEHLVGTHWMPDISGHVLMLEDIGEYEYAIDRKMFTLCNSENFHKVAGVAAGRFSSVPQNDDIQFGQTPCEIIGAWCHRMKVPYLGRADIGHDVNNKIVVWGKG